MTFRIPLTSAGAFAVVLCAFIAWFSPGAAAAATTTVTYRPVADTYDNSALPKRNYGRSKTLRVDSKPVMRAYVRFNVTSVSGPVIRAILSIYTKNRGKVGFHVRATTSGWREVSLKYESAPRLSPKRGYSGSYKDGVWTGIDVTGVIHGKGVYSFGLTTGNQKVLLLASRESKGRAPRLVVESGTPDVAAETLIAAGTISSCDTAGDEATAALVEGILGTVAALGDLVYPSGSAQDYANCYGPTWGRFKDRTRATPGNHDYETPGAAGYYGYFGAAAGDPSKGYYSYELGAWHVVVLNSNCAAVGGCQSGSAQEQWLRADLAAHPTRCTLAYFHHPRFSSSLTSYQEGAAVIPFWQALYDAGAEVVLGAHGRTYERFAPQRPDGAVDLDRGIRQIIVGTGGYARYPAGEPSQNSEVRNDDAFGVLKLTLKSTGYDWQFIPVGGNAFSDSGSTACH